MADDRENGSKLRESDRGRRDREKGSSGRRHSRSRSRSRDRKHNRDSERRSSRERDRTSGRKRSRSRSRSRSREAKRRREDNDRRDDGKERNGDDNNADNKMDVDDRSESETSRKHVEPISLEDLLKKKQEEEAEEAKPVFLTKAQRRELALKRREAEATEKKRQQEEARLSREQELKKAQEERTKDKRDDRDRRRGDDDRGKSKEEREKERQLEQIKMTYLGYKKPKKKVVKITDKTKPEEDWDLTEDTSRTINLPGAVDTNPLFTTKTEFRPVFGRGFFGGIDPSEQLKKMKEGLEHEKDNKKIRQKETEREDLDKKIKKYQGDLVPAKHWSEKTVAEMTQRDWRIFREDHNISTKGGGIPVPIRSWEETTLPGWLKEAIADAKYKKPTAIQMQSIPIGLQRRDIIGVAETGSGKTAAFLIPMLVYISSLPPATDTDGPYALVMAPTRELAIQIENEAAKFAKHFRIRTACLVGGQSIEEQGLQLRKGVEIVIATPGRLVDCLENHYLVLSVCNYVVLDEADRMIDMGFEESLLKVLDAMPSSSWKSENEEEAEKQERDTHQTYRTTIMFSATMPPPVERIAKKYLRRPAVIYIGEVGRTVDRIKQVVVFVKGDADKKRQLESALTNGPKPPVIVFVNQKKTADALAKSINKLGFRATTLHSGRSQDQREWALEEFREGRFDVLVATDVAGRGLDVKGITHVINYDMPTTIEAYTHRIGRTGRAGESGLATSFLTGDDTDVMYDLKAQLTKTNNAIPNELRDHPSAQVKPMNTKPVVMQD